jgi:hypothetical protein
MPVKLKLCHQDIFGVIGGDEGEPGRYMNTGFEMFNLPGT